MKDEYRFGGWQRHFLLPANRSLKMSSTAILCFALIFALEITLITGQHGTNGDNLDELLASIFPQNNGSANINCECVPLNKCYKYNNSVLTTGEGLIDIRFDYCSNSLEICCEEPQNPERVTVPPPVYRRNVTCGYRNENGVGVRITTNNLEAQFGEFPWMIAIMVRKDYGAVYHCGGSLIHPGVVLTAAHCVIAYVERPDDLILRAGEWDSHSEAELIPFQERYARKIIVHRQYLSGPAFNDIALVLLTEKFDFAENVDVICLPTQNEDMDEQNCVASGWGKDNFGENGRYQNILKRVNLPTVPRDTCQKLLRTTRLGPRFMLHASFLCAGGKEGHDTCKGDGGSPLVCPVRGKSGVYQQAGIVAWGIGCGGSVPAVYVSIPHFRNWIDQQLKDNFLDSAYYDVPYE